MPEFNIHPLAALAAGLLLYFADPTVLPLIVWPVVCHELGHIVVLRGLGCRITELDLEPGGLCIKYAGSPGNAGQIAAAAAGPLAGLLYASIAARFGEAGHYSAGISLLLSIFNLLPCLPLDGGRIAAALFGYQISRRLGILCACGFTLFGLWQFAADRGAAAAAAGLLLLSGLRRYYGSSSAISPD